MDSPSGQSLIPPPLRVSRVRAVLLSLSLVAGSSAGGVYNPSGIVLGETASFKMAQVGVQISLDSVSFTNRTDWFNLRNPTNTLIFPTLLAALAIQAAGAPDWDGDEIITPEKELRWAQRTYAEGTNLTACGMFREAESRIGAGIGTATGKLRQLECRAATIAPLQAFVDRLQAVRDRFEDNWTNAVLEAFALEGPIKAYVATNPVVKGELNWQLRSFDWLREELKTGNKRDAGTSLRNFQDALWRQIAAFEELQRLEPAFRTALADLNRARKELDAERSKPLDAGRALRIARRYADAALVKIDSPGSAFTGADWDMDCARAYLNDIRNTGSLMSDVSEVEATLTEAKRLQNLAGVRYYLQKARSSLEEKRPVDANRNIGIAKEIYLSRLKGDSSFEALSEEADALKGAAGQMLGSPP